jgi:sialate O-acetylesterase
MVHPLVPLAVRGAIWYQGESNREDGLLYYQKMQALINGWREVWKQGDFPFYYVQLAPFRYGGDPLLLAQIWEAQRNSLSIPNTGMAVITDVTNLADIHPKNKQDVGKRLALWALARTYGQGDLVYSGPLYRSLEAKAEIDGSTVLVWNDGVAKPAAVRFGWHQEAEPNLMNKEGLPASPFRTDEWPLDQGNKE